jgi:hypothetical protein
MEKIKQALRDGHEGKDTSKSRTEPSLLSEEADSDEDTTVNGSVDNSLISLSMAAPTANASGLPPPFAMTESLRAAATCQLAANTTAAASALVPLGNRTMTHPSGLALSTLNQPVGLGLSSHAIPSTWSALVHKPSMSTPAHSQPHSCRCLFHRCIILVPRFGPSRSSKSTCVCLAMALECYRQQCRAHQL